MDYLTTFALEHLKQSTLTLVLDLSILKEIIPAVLRNPAESRQYLGKAFGAWCSMRQYLGECIIVVS